MGANASTAVPLYASGQVLDAARLNLTNAGIPVFADSSARDAAFGGTGEKTLAEGQFAYIENIAGAAATQYYDGSSWQTLVVSGLTFITSASVSAALTLTVSNVFSATYENYLMTFTNLTTSSGGNVSLQMTTGGTANTSAVYQIGSWRVAYNAGTGNGSGYASNQTSFLAVITDTSGTPSHGSFNFYAPFATQQTGITTLNAGGNQSQVMAGIFAGTTSFDGIKLTATQNMTGTFKFYGIANS